MRWRRGSSASVAGAFGTLLSGVLILGLVSGCTPSGGATPPPRTPDQTSAAPKSPSPSPTPDPEEVAIAGAKRTYIAYWKALDEAYLSDDAEVSVAALEATLTGEALDLIGGIVETNQQNGIRQTGRTVVVRSTTQVVNLQADPVAVEIVTCVDRTKVVVRARGKKNKDLAKFATEQIELRRLKGLWKIAKISSQAAKSC